MTDPGDIWQRYDAKVMQIQVMEARVVALEKEMAQVRDERDHWARICRDLGKKLSVARSLAERLRSAERVKTGRPETLRARRPAELQAGSNAIDNTRHELDRAREVLGLVLTALTKALDDDEVAELGAKLRHHAGGKLLQSITRGSLTLVPVDGRYLVDRGWLQQLDLAGLRRELDVAAQSGVYTMPDDSGPNNEVSQVDLEVEIDEDEVSEEFERRPAAAAAAVPRRLRQHPAAALGPPRRVRRGRPAPDLRTRQLGVAAGRAGHRAHAEPRGRALHPQPPRRSPDQKPGHHVTPRG
jgi:hypothetical protein